MKFKMLLLSMVVSCVVYAQDTTFVQTLTFNDITKRRDVFQFPDSTESYRKILMYYTLKCDAQTTQDQYACGEWDYLTYNFVYDHTGILDSNLINQNTYVLGLSSPDEIDYQPISYYNYYQSLQSLLVIDSTLSESTHSVGIDESSFNLPFNFTEPTTRAQYLYTNQELLDAGLTAGAINRIAFDVIGNGGLAQNLTIRFRNYNPSSISNLIGLGFTQVYKAHTSLSGDSQNIINLTNPFNWNGTMGLLIEISYNNAETADEIQIASSEVGDGKVMISSSNDHFAEFNDGSFIQIPFNGQDFENEISIAFWAWGNPSQLPANTSVFEAFDEYGQRALNVHLPWSNSRVYWDAGSGAGYDRIDKAAVASIVSGQWNHWTFTKNAETGIMNIYVNGLIWHTGTNKTLPIGKINHFTLAKSVGGNNFFPGKIDDFQIFAKELDGPTILDWYNREIDNTHPYFNDLAVHYNFNSDYNIQDLSGNGLHGIPFGSPAFARWNQIEKLKINGAATQRPNIQLFQGEYNTHLETVLVTDSVLVSPLCVVEYVSVDTVLTDLQSIIGWPVGCGYLFNPEGEAIDSTCYSATNTLINFPVSFYGPSYEIIERWEIGRFITPYGINLSLGPQGFTWIYDVTDYAHLLQGSVDLEMGNQQELIDVKFAMINGTPPRDVLRINKVWGNMRSYSYANLSNDVDLSATDVEILPETQSIKMTTRFTGHGHNSNTGNYPHCCEWKNNTHYLFANGQQVQSWNIWQETECALNPVFPQGGTWPGAREGWCPGDLVKDNEFELTQFLSGNLINLDYSITPVPTNNLGMGSGNYMIAMHLLEYGANSHAVDAEVLNVISPSDSRYYSRVNPICREPQIEIRNNSNVPLTSATFTYGVIGAQNETYNWTGNLAPHTKTKVALPVPDLNFWLGDEPHQFVVTISNPNGMVDQYPANDTFKSPFNLPDFYEENFIVILKTNNLPQQNSYTIKNLAGEVVFEKSNLTANTTYNDTLDLAPGCYSLEMIDTGHDGLSYWANTGQGSGFFRFKADGGPVLKNFNPDFGHKVFDSFVIGQFTHVNNPNLQPVVELYPNPNTGSFNLEFSQFTGNFLVEIFNSVGKQVHSETLNVYEYTAKQYDLSKFGSGMYMVKISNSEFQTSRKVIVQ